MINQQKKSYFSFVFSLKERAYMKANREVIHSIKVGIALVLVSILYLLDPTFQRVGENVMWAIMTVVVVFEFFAGATLSKGINRGIGTIIGGGLGCCAAILANKKGEMFEAIVVGTSLFISGSSATYMRQIPRIKKRYDYGVMIFILTFNLVLVTAVRSDYIVELVTKRLSTVGMGLAICICTSILMFPMWASDELHYSTASKFEKLASCVDGCLEEFCRTSNDTDVENQQSIIVQACKFVLHSKANEESLTLSVMSRALKEPTEIMMLSLGWILRELGESIKNMKRCRGSVLITPKLQSMKLQLNLIYSSNSMVEALENDEKLKITCSSLLMEIVEKMDLLVKEVEGLGELANFHIKKLDV
ncbi:Aluminum-activated malate transporter 13 [Abeliophyllum distichum]|uniref:Aluminum-activated malate transporter 13 n=1 Tax=Abeliophyllum distichum TaxID=126358 RepID=A0ABD1RBS4_9LAMI